ncbi:MAG: DsrE family protein [Spirochaetales bacterium]|nr:DsrE family protein [Spirochaetales bacterium]
MNYRYALFAFNGEPMCFAHVLLNAGDMAKKGWDVKIVIEGTATRQIKELSDPSKPFAKLYQQVKESGLIDCVCKACSTQTGSLESAREQGLPICDTMSGHPAISEYIDDGYQVLTF